MTIMKTALHSLVTLAALILLAGLASAQAAESSRIEFRPADTGAVLENPGMGWVLHYYDNIPENYGSRLAPSDTVDEFPGLTVVYLRIPWSYLEPEEGRFAWSVLDTPAQRWIAKGKQIALRISCSESWTRYATPAWVEKAGAKGHNFRPGKGVEPNGPYWEPDYNDPVFLQKLDRFLAALAARHDGNPEVAFVDVGSYGVWGEGHVFASTGLEYSADTVKRHVDLHTKHFKRTLLAANDDYTFAKRGDEAIRYAFERGLTLRDDSILVQAEKNAYFHADLAQAVWPRLPVILESEHYGGSRDRGAWKDGSLYLKAMEEYHASYVSIHWWPREFLESNRDLIARMNRRLGYRIQLQEARLPAKISRKGPLEWSTAWCNAGVAPCLPGGRPALTLKDEKGGIAAVLVDEGLDVRTLAVGPADKPSPKTTAARSLLPFQLKPGKYDVFISVGTITGTPRIALPLANGDAQRRYPIGKLEVTE
jgi:hypothetical protein